MARYKEERELKNWQDRQLGYVGLLVIVLLVITLCRI